MTSIEKNFLTQICHEWHDTHDAIFDFSREIIMNEEAYKSYEALCIMADRMNLLIAILQGALTDEHKKFSPEEETEA